MPFDYEILIVGAGHAGTEAAIMCARLGARTLVVTSNLDTIGQMSCNPAIGGDAQGGVVAEVEALGGVVGRAPRRPTHQFRDRKIPPPNSIHHVRPHAVFCL